MTYRNKALASVPPDLRQHGFDNHAVKRLHRDQVDPAEAVSRADESRRCDRLAVSCWCDLDHNPEIQMGIVEPHHHPLRRRTYDGEDPNPLCPRRRSTLETERRDGEVAQDEEAAHPHRPLLHHAPRRFKRVEGFGDLDRIAVGEVGTGEGRIYSNGRSTDYDLAKSTASGVRPCH